MIIISEKEKSKRDVHKDAAATATVRKAANFGIADRTRAAAFPSVSTGVYGYLFEKATKSAVDAVSDWKEKNKEYPIRVHFYCFSERIYAQ